MERRRQYSLKHLLLCPPDVAVLVQMSGPGDQNHSLCLRRLYEEQLGLLLDSALETTPISLHCLWLSEN